MDTIEMVQDLILRIQGTPALKKFPTLYQKTQTGAIQSWAIEVSALKLTPPLFPEDKEIGVIVTVHGQVGGKLQTTADGVKEGKNPGKANATTPVEQALKEAEAKWTKQKKKGYVETIEDAQAEKTDAVIEGGIEPMLAPNKSFPKDDLLEKSIVYPCFFQPKLDGMRCIAIIENGICTLWSRTRKRIPTVPHIVKTLETAFPTGKVVLDGELYNHEYKDRFEDLLSILRGAGPDAEEQYLKAEYHVYDVPDPTAGNFGVRNSIVDQLFTTIADGGPVKRVHTQWVGSLNALKAAYEAALVDGYEGGMARNADAPYEIGRRSKHLQKMKEFQDGEFRITGVEDGRGKDSGTVAAFNCVTEEGKEFRCRLKATYARRRELWNAPEQWRGKFLTVTFKRWTAEKVPYIPVGKAIRDYE